ncbi:9323_t:CDS:10, partial [Paraglomus occultum]
TNDKLHANWKDLMPSAINFDIQNQAISSVDTCKFCEKPAIIRCLECGGTTFCLSHANEYHGSANWYHFFEQWRNTEYGSLFVEYDRGIIVLSKRCSCSPTFIDAKKIIVQTLYGLAFTYGVMQVYSKLKHYYAVNAKTSVSTDVYRQLFIASRYFDFKAHSISHWLFLPERLREFTEEEVGSTGKTVCPACFKNENGRYFAMADVCFGCNQKATQGIELRETVYDNRQAQKEMDNFVMRADKDRKPNEDCHHRAGRDESRVSKVKRLHYTGLAASICRHEIPDMFAYIELLLKKIRERSWIRTLHWMYDVNCTFLRSLQANDKTRLVPEYNAIMVYHATGHKLQCQLEYHLEKISEFGMTDGEGTERLNWKLQPFFTSLKEGEGTAQRIQENVGNNQIVNSKRTIGYKRAKKTTQAISKAANKLGKNILAYNNLSEQSGNFFEDSTSAIQPLTMTNVIASDCWIWQHFDGLQTAGNVQSSTQWEAICIKDNFDRSLEELEVLREEIEMSRFSGRNTLHGLDKPYLLCRTILTSITNGCRALLAAEHQRVNKS